MRAAGTVWKRDDGADAAPSGRHRFRDLSRGRSNGVRELVDVGRTVKTLVLSSYPGFKVTRSCETARGLRGRRDCVCVTSGAETSRGLAGTGHGRQVIEHDGMAFSRYLL